MFARVPIAYALSPRRAKSPREKPRRGLVLFQRALPRRLHSLRILDFSMPSLLMPAPEVPDAPLAPVVPADVPEGAVPG